MYGRGKILMSAYATCEQRGVNFYYSADRKFLQSMPLSSITFVSNTDTSR